MSTKILDITITEDLQTFTVQERGSLFYFQIREPSSVDCSVDSIVDKLFRGIIRNWQDDSSRFEVGTITEVVGLVMLKVILQSRLNAYRHNTWTSDLSVTTNDNNVGVFAESLPVPKEGKSPHSGNTFPIVTQEHVQAIKEQNPGEITNQGTLLWGTGASITKVTETELNEVDARREQQCYYFLGDDLRPKDGRTYGPKPSDIFAEMKSLAGDCTDRLDYLKRLLKDCSDYKLFQEEINRLKFLRDRFDRAYRMVSVTEYFFIAGNKEMCSFTNDATAGIISDARHFLDIYLEDKTLNFPQDIRKGMQSVEDVWVTLICDFVHLCDLS